MQDSQELEDRAELKTCVRVFAHQQTHVTMRTELNALMTMSVENRDHRHREDDKMDS